MCGEIVFMNCSTRVFSLVFNHLIDIFGLRDGLDYLILKYSVIFIYNIYLFFVKFSTF